MKVSIWEEKLIEYVSQDTVTKDWYRCNLATNKSILVVNATELAASIPNYSSITFSPDGNHLLVSYNVSPISTRSS